MKRNQIKKLKDMLSSLYGAHKGYRIIAETESEYEQVERIEDEIDSIKLKLLELTGDDRYNPSVEAVVKKYRRPYWDFREYGAISLSELYKRKQAKIEIIKHLHKQNCITNSNVNMENINHFHVDKEEIESYIKRRKNKIKKLNRRKRQFDMLMNEKWTFAFYFNVNNRMEEVRDLVCHVFGPNKKAMNAKLDEIRKVLKLTKMLRVQL